jgi:hypothetical protein
MFYRHLVISACILAVSGLTVSLHAQPYERTVRDTVALAPGGVSVENQEGSIKVATWTRNAVAYEARIVSEQAADYVDDTVIEVDTLSQHLSLESTFDDLESRWTFGPEMIGYGVSEPAVHYTLTVPRTAELAIEGTESTIEVTGLRATLQVETEDGTVQVDDQRGTMRIDAHEGPVSITDMQGDLTVDTHEGTATVDGLRGRLLLDTHEGEADVSVDSLAAVQVDTHEGEVALRFPPDAGFDLSTDLGDDARVRGGFDLDALRDEDGNYHGSLRGGGPLVRLTSHEGTITFDTP